MAGNERSVTSLCPGRAVERVHDDFIAEQYIGTQWREPKVLGNSFQVSIASAKACRAGLSSVAGALVLKPLGDPLLGFALGLLVGFAACGVWEVFVYTNVVLRGPGPVIWGLGLFLVFAGVRGVVVGPSQTHPGAAELAATSLLWMGVWIERYVVREALGLKRRGRSVHGHPSVS
jgi:hypothetical protein